MIDSAKFWPEWQRICKRFARPIAKEEAADYVEYLDACGFDTDAALRAAKMVWATNRFFPSPSDFLEGEAASGWTAIREFSDKWNVHLSSDDARYLIEAICPRARRALDALGGFDVVRNAKDMSRLRRDYFEAFGRVVVEDAQGPILPTSAPVRAALGAQYDGPSKLNVDLLKQLAGVTVEMEQAVNAEPPLGWEGIELVQ